MPYSKDPAQYPVEFAQAVAEALDQGELAIPTDTAASLRRHLQAYIKAVSTTTPEAADLMVRTDPSGVIICRRSRHPAAKDVARALNRIVSPESAEAAFASLLTKRA